MPLAFLLSQLSPPAPAQGTVMGHAWLTVSASSSQTPRNQEMKKPLEEVALAVCPVPTS